MTRHVVAKTRSGVEVYVNLTGSSVATKIARQPHLLTLAKEVLATAKLKAEVQSVEKDMGRVVGTTDVVATTDNDTIFYAKRPKSNVFTRFVKNRKHVPTSFVSIELKQIEKRSYQILDLRFGQQVPALPGDQNESDQSKTFWSSHAVVWENGLTQIQTVTKDCPWSAV